MVNIYILTFMATVGIALLMFSSAIIVRMLVEALWKNEEMKQIPVIRLREVKQRGYIDLS